MKNLSMNELATVSGGEIKYAPLPASAELCEVAITNRYLGRPGNQPVKGPDLALDELRFSFLCTGMDASQFRSVLKSKPTELGLK